MPLPSWHCLVWWSRGQAKIIICCHAITNLNLAYCDQEDWGMIHGINPYPKDLEVRWKNYNISMVYECMLYLVLCMHFIHTYINVIIYVCNLYIRIIIIYTVLLIYSTEYSYDMYVYCMYVMYVSGCMYECNCMYMYTVQ